MNPWGLWMHVEEAAPESASWLSYRPGRWGLRSDCTSGPGGLSCPVWSDLHIGCVPRWPGR